jgi:hypothetical protein
MINTTKSITKNFQNCCLNEGENLKLFYTCRSKKLKKAFVLAYTSEKRILMGSVKLFGKMSLIDQYSCSDIQKIELAVKTGLAPNYFILISVKGEDDVYRIQLENPQNFIKTVYSENPNSLPEYLKNYTPLSFLAVKDNTMLIFTKEKLLFLNFDGNKTSINEQYDYQEITDFDVYPQKIGDYQNLYLKINNQDRTFLANFYSIDNSLNFLIDTFKQTNINKAVPEYMQDDEKEIVNYVISKQLGVGFGKQRARVTTKNIYLLEKNKNGKLQMFDKIEIANIDKIKADTIGTALKSGNNKHEVIITTKDGKKYNLWNSDQDVSLVNKALDYIQQNMH